MDRKLFLFPSYTIFFLLQENLNRSRLKKENEALVFIQCTAEYLSSVNIRSTLI